MGIGLKTFKIYFTSDVHGHIFPTTYADREEKPMGILKIANSYKKDGNTIIIDGGDILEGSPYTYCTHDEVYEIHPIAYAMNKAGYDYVCLGNHDFNYGLDNLKRYLEALDAKCMCANIKDKARELPITDTQIKVLENGLKIGIVGLCTDYITHWEKEVTLKQLDIYDPFEKAKELLAELKKEVDVTVCVYHGGFECDINDGRRLTETTENVAYKICKELDFDIMLSGHQHILIEGQDVCGTFAVQPGHDGQYFIEIDGCVDEYGKKEYIGKLIRPEADVAGEAYDKLVQYENRVQTWLDAPKGHLSIALPADEYMYMAVNGSNIANFINMVQLESSGADIAATALGNEIKGFDKDVTVRDVVSTYVYPNTLFVLEITGKQLKRYIERTAEFFELFNGKLKISEKFLKPKLEFYNYDFFSNLYYTIDVSRNISDRVVSMVFKGKEVKEDDKFSICINNYRASGGGQYDFLRECTVIKEIQVDLPSQITAYIEKYGNIEVDTTKYVTVTGYDR